MSTMSPLVDFKITHDYFEPLAPDVFFIRSERFSRLLFGGPRFPFIAKEDGHAMMYGDPDLFREYVSTSRDGLTLEFSIKIKDPVFLCYTPSYLPDTFSDKDMDIIRDNPNMNEMKVRIRMTPESCEGAFPLEKRIHFKTRERYWRYMLIPRNKENDYQDIGMEDVRGTIGFDKAERLVWMEQEVYLVTSSCPVRLKAPRILYDASDISVFERREYGKRILMKHVWPPEPGHFHVKELQGNNEILQIIYI